MMKKRKMYQTNGVGSKRRKKKRRKRKEKIGR
jgi:hypothetical protein